MRTKRLLGAGVVAVLLSTMVAVVAAPGVALAAPLQSGHWYNIRNVASGLYLSVNNGQDQNGAKVIHYRWSPVPNTGEPGPDQSWYLEQRSSGWWSIRNAGTNPWKALVMNGAGTANGIGAVQYTYDPTSTDQLWGIFSQGNFWKLQNHKSGRCLAIADGANAPEGRQAIQYDCLPYTDQQWNLDMFL